MTDEKKVTNKTAKETGYEKNYEERFTQEKIARAKIIVRAADSAYETNNVHLLFEGVLEALAMSKAEAVLLAKAIDESVDFIKLMSRGAK